MTQMSKVQRTAILNAHNYPGRKLRGLIMANKRTVAVLLREDWATKWIDDESGWVTTAGLLAAGVDMDAIHAEALVENTLRECDRNLAMSIADERRRLMASDFRNVDVMALNNVMGRLHAEALTEDQRRRVVKVREGRPEAVDSDGMILAVLPAAIEQAHAEALADDVVRAARAIVPDAGPASVLRGELKRMHGTFKTHHARAIELVTTGGASNVDIAQTFAGLERERAEQVTHLTAQRNALGTYIGCDGPACRTTEGRIDRNSVGHKLQGA